MDNLNGVDIDTEYGLIVLKQSSLTRSSRDAVVAAWQKQHSTT